MGQHNKGSGNLKIKGSEALEHASQKELKEQANLILCMAGEGDLAKQLPSMHTEAKRNHNELDFIKDGITMPRFPSVFYEREKVVPSSL